MRNKNQTGIQVPKILLPNEKVDLTRWAVIACDQFTSQPQYWQDVTKLVGESPSTLHLILPEVYLGTGIEKDLIQSTQQTMGEYIDRGIFRECNNFIYVERSVAGKTRRGIMVALDLEQYDFSPDSQSLIRATEGTILDRLPPRIRIREEAPLEIPHILVLFDDPEDGVIGTIEKQKSRLPSAYDFELMEESGHLSGWIINDERLEKSVFEQLQKLASPEVFYPKYQVNRDQGVLLFAVGDGNHSLATAKSIWEKLKLNVGMEHPARYALVEIVNIHDHGIEFEPIHRVLFDLRMDPHEWLTREFGEEIQFTQLESFEELKVRVDAVHAGHHHIGLIEPAGYHLVTFFNPTANLPVGSLQPVLDKWIKEHKAGHMDYVHGDEAVCELGRKKGNLGFYLPGMPKDELFRTVILDGVLPRKTFSMGEAKEKRFYMEARKITV